MAAPGATHGCAEILVAESEFTKMFQP